MTKPDDSSLAPEDLQAVEKRARYLLDRAGAWERFPVPIEDILAAANVRLASSSVFDPVAILEYLKGKAADTGRRIKSAIAKVFGIYDAADSIIHIDETVGKSKRTFLTLHETGHHDLPVHRRLFRLFQDCEKTLAPDVADQFDREANNFARFVLFKGATFAQFAADSAFDIKTPINLAKKFGASVYAAAREFARTNHRACVVYVLEPIEFVQGCGAQAAVRRIEASSSFLSRFGQPTDNLITLNHVLGPVLPIGRKMSRPTTVCVKDRNGANHECLAEAFDTTHNVIILMYPIQALGNTTVILPSLSKRVF